MAGRTSMTMQQSSTQITKSVAAPDSDDEPGGKDSGNNQYRTAPSIDTASAMT